MCKPAVTLSIALVTCLLACVAAGCSGGAAGPTSQAGPRASAARPLPAGPAHRAPGSPAPGSQHASGTSAASFWRGTDSWPVAIAGNAPYDEPVIGGPYGGYFGMAGNWARQLGCRSGSFLAWSAGNSAQAAANHADHVGVGVGGYWFMGGPGVDPGYNGTASEASAWGARQAAWTLTAAAADQITYPVLWADIELPGIAPAPDNGWTSVYTGPCTGVVRRHGVPSSVSRAEFDGFAAYLARHSSYRVGVYSSPDVWATIFGTGPASLIPGVYEWTYEPETASLAEPPSGWCLPATSACARFFGGQDRSSRYAVAWQWSGGGGVRNPYGDFDQILSAPPG